MKTGRNLSILLLVFFLLCGIMSAADKMIFQVEGEYLAYSYDHNWIYGEHSRFVFGSYQASCLHLKIDVTSRLFLAYGDVTLRKNDEVIAGDELVFDPVTNRGILTRYGDTITEQKIGDEGTDPLTADVSSLESWDLTEIRRSLLYFSGQSLDISEDLDVYGYNIAIHVEGMESVGFKKLKLSGVMKKRRTGFSFDRVWYTRSEGIISRASFFYNKEKKVNSLTRLHYEERSVLKDYEGPQRQVDVMTSTTVMLKEDFQLGLAGNYNSSNLWNVNLRANKNWKQKVNLEATITHNKPINLTGETWVGLRSQINGGKWGTFSILGKYEFQDQVLANFSYGNTFFKQKLSLMLSSSYSQIKLGQSSDYSKILTANVNMSYNTKVFNLATNYLLNYDLFGHQLLSQPQLRLGLNPFPLYAELLTLNVYNLFILNRVRMDDIIHHAFSNNTVFSLSTMPVNLLDSFKMNFSLQAEQFLEREGRNFTSGGFIINAQQRIAKGIFLEGFYNVQSRRKTQGWLIEGTTSQDLSLVFRLKPSENLAGWTSLSYDPKNNQLRQSFTDISFRMFKNWEFHGLLNYDFLLKKISNIDLYLIRHAGRFQLRFIWRSLARQFLVELVPQ